MRNGALVTTIVSSIVPSSEEISKLTSFTEVLSKASALMIRTSIPNEIISASDCNNKSGSVPR